MFTKKNNMQQNQNINQPHSINNNKTQQQINSKKTITIIQININYKNTRTKKPDRQYKNRHHNNPRNKTKTHS